MQKPKGLGKPEIGERGAKIGVYGLFGSGKTELVMTATQVGHLLMVDTEGRSQYYDAEAGHGFEVVYSKNINDAINLLKYAESLHAEGTKAIFAIDSFSSMWFEQQEVAARQGTTSRGTPKFDSWAVAKKPLKVFYAALAVTPVDCIITMRSKPKYNVDKGVPTDVGYSVPDTERGINYAVDLVIEMQKDELKPGTKLTGDNFKALVVKTSGPKEDNPIPIGTTIVDPSFSKLIALRLGGEGRLDFAEFNVSLQIAHSTILTASDLTQWIEGLGLDTTEVYDALSEQHGSYRASMLPTYIEEVWALRGEDNPDVAIGNPEDDSE